MNEITISSMLPASRKVGLTRSKTYVGIDFGTSTTVVSIAGYDEAEGKFSIKSLRLKQMLADGAIYSSEIVPTVIAWTNGHILVGEGASRLKYKLQKGRNIWYSFKMELGEDLGAKYYDSEIKDKAPFNIKNPVDAARVFFSYLKYLILSYCKENNKSTDILYAVSIPASFEANQRRDLLSALAANGMNVSSQSFIDEPNAAFISYAAQCAAEGQPLYINPSYNPKVLVFDFGGGTCDISVLEIGQDANGFFSKNIAISKFTQLGGDDIDRYITYQYLLPRFLAENAKKKEDFRTKELKIIASALYKVAERLKILKNKELANLTADFVMPDCKNDDSRTEIETPVEVVTSKGILYQDKFYLTNRELTETMAVFLQQGRIKTKKISGQDDYNSIFLPIESAVKKSHTPVDEIDYVLFIGGSSQSPYIQEAVRSYFKDSEMLLPVNLQTHVSQGAAIHSLLFNGMGKCTIQPITSEPILVITKDAYPKVILPAGTQIPCTPIEVNDLVTSYDGQRVVELPICVGNPNKMLFNLKIKANTERGFRINSQIKLIIEVNADKLLLVKASCLGVNCEVEPLNPFANKELTTQERMVLQAERQANLDADKNGGVFPRQSLDNLIAAYTKAGYLLKAAEAKERKNEPYPNDRELNNIGVLYSNAGNKYKAIEFYKRAIEANDYDDRAHFNLGLNLKQINREEYKKEIRCAYDLDPSDPLTMIEMGEIENYDGNYAQAQKYRQQAFDLLNRIYKNGKLDKVSSGWFAYLAGVLGKDELAEEIRKSLKENKDNESYYNTANLSKTRSNYFVK